MVAAFVFLAEGWRRERHFEILGIATYATGISWLLFHALIGAGFAAESVADLKGSFQRPTQVAFGLWIALVAAAFALHPPPPIRPDPVARR